MTGSFCTAGIRVGGGAPPLFLAEIGALFGQDIDAALGLVDAIAKASRGRDKLPVLLKTEILHDVDIVLDDDTTQTYLSSAGARKVERYRDLIARKVLPLEAYARLFRRAGERGLAVCASVYDQAGADFAKANGVALIKIASSNLPHLPLIRYVASLGLPTMIDTGRATIAEVDRAVRMARVHGANALVVQHSQDGHPSPAENGNLRTLETYRRLFETPVALSDHFAGTQMLHVAIGVGVDVLERNIAGDPDRLDDDHAFSSGIGDVERLLLELHSSWRALGRPFRDIENKAGLVATSGRMGIVTRRAVRAGEAIGPDTVAFALPNKGIGVEYHDLVTGWTFVSNLPPRAPVRWKDVAGA